MNFQLGNVTPPRLSNLLSALVAVFAITKLLLEWWRRLPYPPGPRGLPFLGIARQHPTSEPWRTYAQWGREYGNKGIISFQILGRRFVVINSRSAVDDLLVQRGSIYSDRPFPEMSGRLMKRGKSIFVISHNERFKMYRKLLHQGFNSRAAQDYWSVQERETHVFLRDMLRTPERLPSHIKRNAGAVILKITYGYSAQPENDHFVALAEDSMHFATLAAKPGKWLVDSFPILRYLPIWFPGAGFKRKAKQWSDKQFAQLLEPHNYVKQEMSAGRAVPSFTSQHLSSDEAYGDAEHEDIVLWTAGALYTGGSDTSVSAVYTFFFALIMHPEIQKRAQDEVDAVVGHDRLPTMHDRGSLPYVDCLIKEVLRWNPVGPMALPHATSAADEYNGYSIPKGTYVIANLWAMLHDEDVYPNPMEFDPERFEGPCPQPDPREFVFGRGRRVCPGQHIAEASVFIQVVSVLATLDVRRALDAQGREIVPEPQFTTGIVSYVKPFECRVTPRSVRTQSLIERVLAHGDS